MMAERKLLYRSLKSWRDVAVNDKNRWEKDIRALQSIILKDKLYAKAIVSLTEPKSIENSTDSSLLGVPYLLKDLFDVAGIPTTASSTFLRDERGIPSDDSAVYQWLSKAAAAYIGKTHLNEFAYGLDGVNPHFGTVPNPNVPDRLAGGSSSGSAYAVAKGWVPFAVGTDTGGSIRVPSAFCGLFGFRLTTNHPLSTEGCFPLAPSYDTAGWFTRTAGDMLVLISNLGDPKIEKSPKGLHIIEAYFGLNPEIYNSAISFSSKLADKADKNRIGEWQSVTQGAVSAFNVLQSSEAYEVHKDWLQKNKAHYDPATWARIMRAESWTTEDQEHAYAKHQELNTFFDKYFSEHDYLIIPATPAPAPLISEGMPDGFRSRLLALTAPASITGLPVLSIPIHLSSGFTSGLQILLPRDIEKAVSIAKSILTHKSVAGTSYM